MTIELIARSLEKTKYPGEFEPEVVNNGIKELAGKAAGICYAPDDYLSDGIQNSEKALKRASFNAKSGHYSVYEHSHLTFLVECTKAMAMVLNSTRLYSTSEKSARYTKMHPETEYERDFYGEWMGTFSKLIKESNPDLSDKDVEKLSMENARYLTSVFTPTFLMFTVPSDRAIMLPEWLDDLSSKIFNAKLAAITNGEDSKIFELYYDRIVAEASALSIGIKTVIGESIDPTLNDHKDIGIRFFDTIEYLNYVRDNNKTAASEEDKIPVKVSYTNKSYYYGDVYKSKYKASFASVAQIQRHRTTQVSISTPDYTKCYIPKIIRGTEYEARWIECYNILIENGVCPQAMLLSVEERGAFNDFVLKCKERLCARTQLETEEVVRDQVEKFYKSKNLSAMNRKILENMVDKDGNVLTRCQFKGYTCNEPCNRVKSNYDRTI